MLGVDIGNKYFTVSSIVNGNIEVILNEASKRRTNNVV